MHAKAWDGEAGGLQILDQPGLHSKISSNFFFEKSGDRRLLGERSGSERGYQWGK